MNTENITYVITGRGARIKHIAHEGTVLCPRDNATQPAVNRFEKLPVCEACAEALAALENELEAAADLSEELVELDEDMAAELAADADEIVEIHFSARVTSFMRKTLADQHPQLADELRHARLVRNGRGYTAFTTTTRTRANILVAALRTLLAELTSGERDKGLKGGMNFQPEAVAKGIAHITADLDGDEEGDESAAA